MEINNKEVKIRKNFWEYHADSWKDIIGSEDAFNRYFREDSFNTILDFFPKQGRILDYGCGPGTQMLPLIESGYEVEGIDFSEKTIQNLKQINPEAKAFVAEGSNLPFEDASFDGAYSIFAIFSMTPEYEACVREFSGVLKPGASFLVRTRTKFRLSELLKFPELLKDHDKGEDLKKTRKRFTMYEHRFSYPELENLFGKHDLEIENSRGLQAVLGELQYVDFFRQEQISNFLVPLVVEIDNFLGRNKYFRELGLGMEIRGRKKL